MVKLAGFKDMAAGGIKNRSAGGFRWRCWWNYYRWSCWRVNGLIDPEVGFGRGAWEGAKYGAMYGGAMGTIGGIRYPKALRGDPEELAKYIAMAQSIPFGYEASSIAGALTSVKDYKTNQVRGKKQG